MAATKDSLQVTQFISGKREKVFQAWADQDLVSKWLCPEECRVTYNEADVRVGGKFRESMKCGDDIHTVFGAYREIVPGKKLVFRHQWEEPNSIGPVVAVDLTNKNCGTEVTLTRQGFRNAAATKCREDGWICALRNPYPLKSLIFIWLQDKTQPETTSNKTCSSIF
jgi:glutathione S-transferase